MTPREVLKSIFGYDSFREGQEEVISAILSGQDALSVMPTGAGKSICYQVPALLLSGITLVISPLISLMQDQVKALGTSGVRAAYINSTLSEAQTARALYLAQAGTYKIIYVAPERLNNPYFLDFAAHADIAMVTVDEAHCISQWGQDFRPSYLHIAEFVDSLPRRPVVSAFTATATNQVREDIVSLLHLSSPHVLVTGFDRPNLCFSVEHPRRKDDFALAYVQSHPSDSGIIYCATRKTVDTLYERLSSHKLPVSRYHAGMGAAERKISQEDFVYDRTPVMIATNAFGMGIDKSNVRYVLHYNMPQSMENYYQEAGRAGRDGEPSSCILLFSPQDIIINRYLLSHKEFTDLSPEEAAELEERDNARLAVMERYCKTSRCFRAEILRYFGESPKEKCGNCGNCLRENTYVDMTDAAKAILNCVYETRGRYGTQVVLGTLLGSRRNRLVSIGTTEYKTFGALKGMDEALLQATVDKMLEENLLKFSEDGYRMLRFGENVARLKEEDAKVMVVLPQTQESLAKKKTPRQNYDPMLFDALRVLRRDIASAHRLPPYVIFTDKTLAAMCQLLPTTEEKMLSVPGVGAVKYEQYGLPFQNAICEYVETHAAIASEVPQKMHGKEEFVLPVEAVSHFPYQEYLNISGIRDALNALNPDPDQKKLRGTKITFFLCQSDIIREDEKEGLTFYLPTEKGIEMGVRVIENTAESGKTYPVLEYPESVQKEIVGHFSSPEAVMSNHNEGTPWSDAEDALLKKEYLSGMKIREMAASHGRTNGAIRSRLRKQGFIE